MKKPLIVTDSCCDLPLDLVKDYDIPIIKLSFSFKGKNHTDDFGQSIGYKEFYDEVRGGEVPTTSQINTYDFEQFFAPYLEKGEDIIYISFSSALSGTCQSAMIAKETLNEKYPQGNLTVVDSKCASMGQGLLVYLAYKQLEQGKTKDEIVAWLEDNKMRLNHWFTVSDLNHLKRGGRVSAASATVGTLLSIKPILHVDNEGRLVPKTKVKGRKKSIKSLCNYLQENISEENQTVFISHGDCEDEANKLAELIKDVYKPKEIILNYIGPVIGSHSGPGTIALFFMGEER
ncbi:DegV family protein [Proteinivorax hydrogeniformans]|uniref:DegV family protein n=1 Tax=Proteinivorax hydrogeniformans TaxID=1826727 RepID=A0AAU8HR39_9FIRM